MRKKRVWLFVNLGLAALLFASSVLGQLMGIEEQALRISVVWPTAGISLAALLILGYRAWPGVFIGNYVYNILFISGNLYPLETALLAGGVFAAGSLMQALFQCYILRSFTTESHFSTFHDMIIFLLPVITLGSLIAPIIGTTVLWAINPQPLPFIGYTWITFWVGDSLGALILTPLIFVWLFYPFPKNWRFNQPEILFMGSAFAILSFLTIFLSYPIAHLFIPLCIWITYRFRIHGAALALFLTASAMIIPTVLGYGSFVETLEENRMLIMASFIEMIAVMCYLLAGAVYEKHLAWHILKRENVSLEKQLEKSCDEVKNLCKDTLLKEKMQSLGILSLNLVRFLHKPIYEIQASTMSGSEVLHVLKQLFAKQKGSLDPQSGKILDESLESLQRYLDKIERFDKRAFQMMDQIYLELQKAAEKDKEVKSINVHTLLNKCLDAELEDPQMDLDRKDLTVSKDYYHKIAMIRAMPEELKNAFRTLFRYTLRSLLQKQKESEHSFRPKLEIQTISGDSKVRVVIEDNGAGVSASDMDWLNKLSKDAEAPESLEDLKFKMAYDAIASMHHGKMEVASKQGRYLRFTIDLPIHPNSFS